MANFSSFVAIAIMMALSSAIVANAGDPDILKDFITPIMVPGVNLTSDFFTYTGFRQLVDLNITGSTAIISKASMKEFPALEGQSVSVAAIIYPPSGINPPHVHPRSAELLIVLQGVLEVGFVDTTNKLFKQTLQAPDLFVFPKGLVHFQVNTRSDSPAFALGIFGSANAGTSSLPVSVFGSGIAPEILAEAFKTDVQTISKLIALAEISRISRPIVENKPHQDDYQSIEKATLPPIQHIETKSDIIQIDLALNPIHGF